MMHELSIALSLLEITEDTMRQNEDAELVAVHVRIGPMSGVVCEALQSAFSIARQDSAFPNAELVIEETPLLVQCPPCGKPQPALSVNDLRCRECGTIAGNIVAGREMEISALEVRDRPL